MSISLTNTISVAPTASSSSTVTYVPSASSGSHSGVSVTTVLTSGKALKYSSAPASVTGYLRITGITITNTTVTVAGNAGLYINSTWGPSSTATVSIAGTGQTSVSKTTKPYASGATYQSFGSFSWSWSRAASAATKVITVSVSFGSSSWYSGDTITITYNITIPKLPTYTITYKANGGTGSDQTQSKTYGVNATLKAANTFTRTNYTFTKWNTAANGSGTSYNAGASYAGNANLTLYAQWQSTYTKPTITNLKAYRVGSSGSSTADLDGTYIYITFNYTRGKNGTAYITTGNTQSVTVGSLTITSSHSWTNDTGTYTGWASGAAITSSYTVTVTLADNNSASGHVTTASTIVGPATYPITITGNSKISFGIPTEIYNSGDQTLRIRKDNIRASVTPTGSGIYAGAGMYLYDGDNAIRGRVRLVSLLDGRQGVQLETVREGVTANLYALVDTNGTAHLTSNVPLRVQGHSSAIGTTVRSGNGTEVNIASNGSTWQDLSSSASIELTAGSWIAIGTLNYAANSTGVRGCRLMFGTTPYTYGSTFVQAGTSTTRISCVTPAELTSTTTVYVQGMQNSGSSLKVTAYVIAIRIA